MMDVTFSPVFLMRPGAELFASPDGKTFVVRDGGEHWAVNPFGAPKEIPAPDLSGYEETLSIPNEGENVALMRVEIVKDDAPEHLVPTLEKGVPLTLENIFDADGDGEQDFDAVLFRILDDVDGKLVVLAALTPSETTTLGTDENVVAVIDLLGFSDIMSQSSLDEIEEQLVGGLGMVLGMTDMFSTTTTFMDEDGEFVFPIGETSNITHGVISDTIVLNPKSKRGTPLRELCKAIALFIDTSITTQKWLFRGGIDVGSFRFIDHRNMYLGKALIAAHQLEVAQNWGGCILSENVSERFPAEVAELQEDGLIVEWEVPLKPAPRSQKALAVNWCHFASGMHGKRLERLEAMLADAPPRATQKVENTLAFLKAMEASGRSAQAKITISAIKLNLTNEESE